MKGIKADRWKYKPKQNKIFSISRSKFSNYLYCKRCFYLDVVKGLKSPSMPGWPLNSATDEMLKNEFDIYRSSQRPHPDMLREEKLKNVVPYQHKNINLWRQNFQGFKFIDYELNLELKGAIDDIWIDKKTNELIIVDYKSTAKKVIDEKKWLNDKFTDPYLKQMNFYTYIFEKSGFKIKTTFFYIVNAQKEKIIFNNEMKFKSYLIEYKPNIQNLSEQLKDMKKLMDSEKIPDINEDCESCNYLLSGQSLLNFNKP
tara:strand:- start:922 stop:1692 length:771 start_codon:yes stop_codon:yes gene_type:complete